MRTPITRTSPDGRIVVTRYELNEYEVIVDRVVEGTCTNRTDAWQLGRDTLAGIVAMTAAPAPVAAKPSKRSAKRTPPARIVYASPCGRLSVTRYDHRDFGIVLDSNYIGSEAYQHEAEMIGHDALCETLRDEAVLAADEQAERDALAELLLERDEDAAAYGEDRAADEQRLAAYGWGL